MVTGIISISSTESSESSECMAFICSVYICYKTIAFECSWNTNMLCGDEVYLILSIYFHDISFVYINGRNIIRLMVILTDKRRQMLLLNKLLLLKSLFECFQSEYVFALFTVFAQKKIKFASETNIHPKAGVGMWETEENMLNILIYIFPGLTITRSYVILHESQPTSFNQTNLHTIVQQGHFRDWMNEWMNVFDSKRHVE